MTEKIRTQGYKKPADPLLGKAKNHSAVAQKTKFKKENVSQTGAIVPVPEQEDIITLRYDKSDEQFKELASDFEEDNDVALVINNEGEDIIVDVPIEQSAEFIEFMADNGVKEKEGTEKAVEDVKATEKSVVDAKSNEKTTDNVTSTEKELVDTKIKVSDSDKKDVASDPSAKLKCTTDEIIANAQSKRSKRAVTSDKLRTAKKVGDKENAFDLMSWLKNPSKTDLKGVDDAE